MRRLVASVSISLLLVLAGVVPPASADVIELRSGERVEGAFKGADENAVRIEVDGRIVTFTPAEVRAIYYGPAPAPMQSVAQPERDDALGALGTLRSVARTGVTYQEYTLRVDEARVIVDRYVRAEDDAPAVKFAIADALHFYGLAATAWNAVLGKGNYATVGTDPALVRCGTAQRFIAESKRKDAFIWRSKGAGEAMTAGRLLAEDGMPILWSCAADRLAVAERLATEKRK